MALILRRPVPISHRPLPISRRLAVAAARRPFVPLQLKISMISLSSSFVPKLPTPLAKNRSNRLNRSLITPRMSILTPGNVKSAVVWFLTNLIPFVLLIFTTYKTVQSLYEEVPVLWKRLDNVRTGGPYPDKKVLLKNIWNAVMTDPKKEETSELITGELIAEVKEELESSARSTRAVNAAVADLKEIIADIRQFHDKKSVCCKCGCDNRHEGDHFDEVVSDVEDIQTSV